MTSNSWQLAAARTFSPKNMSGLIDDVLHVVDELGVGPIHDGDTASANFAVEGGKSSADNVVEHEERTFMDPFPRQVEMTGLERVEDGLDAIEVGLAVLADDAVETSLESGGVCLLLVEGHSAGTRVALEVAHAQLDVLSGELLLLGLELQELLAVDEGTSGTSTSTTSGSARRLRDARALGVESDDGINPGLTLSLRTETLRRLHGGTEQESSIGTRRPQSPMICSCSS